MCCTGRISYKALTEKGIKKKHVDHPLAKESPIKDEIYPWGAARKTGLQKEIPANSPVIANSPLQNIIIPSPQKQLRTHINNVPKLTNENLIEHQPEETNPGNSGSSGDSNIALRPSQQERRPPKYLEDYKTSFDKYRNDVKKGPNRRVIS